MRNTLLVAQNMLKMIFKKKQNIVVYLILPVVVVLFFMNIAGKQSASKVDMGLLDKDNSKISKEMLLYLNNTGKFNIKQVKESEIEEKVASRKIDFVLIIPKNLEKNIMKDKADVIDIISIKGEDATAWIKSYINIYMKNLLDMAKVSNGDEKVFNSIYEGYRNKGLKLSTEKVVDVSVGKAFTQTGIGMFIMIVMMAAFSTSRLILKEKRERTYQRICTTPVNSSMYVLGNVIANIIIVFLQVSLVILIAINIFKFNMYMPQLELLVILMSFGMVAISLGMLCVAFSNSTDTASILSNLIITPTCMLGGCFWPVDIMPKVMQNVANFIPQFWAIDAIKKAQIGKSFSDVLVNIVILLGFSVVFFLIAVYKMKRENKVSNFV